MKNNNLVQFTLYILIKNDKPIYVGCTSNLGRRIKTHRSSKDFDDYIVLKEYDNKYDALTAENSLIRFISMFGGDEWLNAKYEPLKFKMITRSLFQTYK